MTSALAEALLLHEDVFYKYFEPYRHPMAQHNIFGGIGLETFGKDLELVHNLNPDFVWTVVDGENGDLWITPGVRFVNRVCYLVTRRSHIGFEVDFRCPRRMRSLTPLGLKRQLIKLQRTNPSSAPTAQAHATTRSG